MSRYGQGYRLERRVVKVLEEAGFVAHRAAGSKGLWDVFAYGPRGWWVVQCKRSKAKPSKKTFRLLEEGAASLPPSTQAVLAWQPPRGRLVFFALTAGRWKEAVPGAHGNSGTERRKDNGKVRKVQKGNSGTL